MYYKIYMLSLFIHLTWQFLRAIYLSFPILFFFFFSKNLDYFLQFGYKYQLNPSFMLHFFKPNFAYIFSSVDANKMSLIILENEPQQISGIPLY